LYLFFYYVGASVAGSAGGKFWERWRWSGVAGFVAVMLAGALGMALLNARQPVERVRSG
jgi:YNFM family putative membrane transporter